jgi:hypothetical protein
VKIASNVKAVMIGGKVSIGENDQNLSFAGILIVFEYLSFN